jgi:hypothetical protein
MRSNRFGVHRRLRSLPLSLALRILIYTTRGAWLAPSILISSILAALPALELVLPATDGLVGEFPETLQAFSNTSLRSHRHWQLTSSSCDAPT